MSWVRGGRGGGEEVFFPKCYKTRFSTGRLNTFPCGEKIKLRNDREIWSVCGQNCMQVSCTSFQKIIIHEDIHTDVTRRPIVTFSVRNNKLSAHMWKQLLVTFRVQHDRWTQHPSPKTTQNITNRIN